MEEIMKSESDQLAKFEKWMRQAIYGSHKPEMPGINGVSRWKRMQYASEETVLEHTWKMAFIIQVLVAYETNEGNPHNLNFYLLLACAVNHDMGEGVTGFDCPADLKTDEIEETEKQAFEAFLDLGVPPEVRAHFPPPIDQDPEMDETHRDFWRAAELVGYALFALGELQREEKTGFRNLQRVIDFQTVICRAKNPLENLAKTFFSIHTFLNAINQEEHRLRQALGTSRAACL